MSKFDQWPVGSEKMSVDAVIDRVHQLHERAEAFFDRVQAAHPRAITCAVGCATCCEVDLSVFPAEALLITEAIAALSEPVLRAAAERASAGQHCALLDPETERCLVYEARPLICRTHGLAVIERSGEEESHCPLNYRENDVVDPPLPDDTLVVERLNVPLALIDHLSTPNGIASGRRVRLAELVTARYRDGDERSGREIGTEKGPTTA